MAGAGCTSCEWDCGDRSPVTPPSLGRGESGSAWRLHGWRGQRVLDAVRRYMVWSWGTGISGELDSGGARLQSRTFANSVHLVFPSCCPSTYSKHFQKGTSGCDKALRSFQDGFGLGEWGFEVAGGCLEAMPHPKSHL